MISSFRGGFKPSTDSVMIQPFRVGFPLLLPSTRSHRIAFGFSSFATSSIIWLGMPRRHYDNLLLVDSRRESRWKT